MKIAIVACLDFSALTNAMWGGRLNGEKYFAMIAPLLSSYLDESADKHRKDVLCVGGILMNEIQLNLIRDAWNEKLKEAEIGYFHFTECKGLSGEFSAYQKKYKGDARNKANGVLADLEGILLSVSWIGFGSAVIIQDYRGVLRDIPASKFIYREDPTESCYGQMMYEIAREVRKNAKGHRVAYFIDQSSDYPKIADMFRGITINHPIIGKTMVSIAPLDDKEVPALQMADLVVGRIRESFTLWRKSEKGSRTLDEDWSVEWSEHIANVGIWDRAHMLREIRTTLNSLKFKDGTIGTRPPRKASGADLRRQEKARRRNLVKERIGKQS